MDEISRRAMLDIEADGLLDAVRSHFRELNEDEGLTAEDRQRLKTYYLEHLTTPRAKEPKILSRRLPQRTIQRCPPKVIRFATPKQIPIKATLKVGSMKKSTIKRCNPFFVQTSTAGTFGSVSC